MLQVNSGILIGCGLLLLTIIIVGLFARWMLSDAYFPDLERKKNAVLIWRSVFGSAICLALMAFILVFLWTGINVVPTGDQPEGKLDTGGVLKLETSTGENRPEGRADRIKEGTKIQKEGQEELDDFRKDFFKPEEQEKAK